MFNYIGTAMLIVILCYIVVDVIHSRKINSTGLAGRLILVVVIFIALLRT